VLCAYSTPEIATQLGKSTHVNVTPQGDCRDRQSPSFTQSLSLDLDCESELAGWRIVVSQLPRVFISAPESFETLCMDMPTKRSTLMIL
jgi:hypothetical protein